jgi:SAM-dependent methyltransferase
VSEVPTDHRWYDAGYVDEWASRTEHQPHRPAVLDAISAALPDRARRVVEIGSGPGFLAARLLADHANIEHYVLVDVSPRMHELAHDRLTPYAERVQHVETDFRDATWVDAVPRGVAVDAAVTLQAVHELRHASRIPAFYAQARTLLPPGGTFVVADYVNTGAGTRDHYLTVAEHLAALSAAGFDDVHRALDLGAIACVVARRRSEAAQ